VELEDPGRTKGQVRVEDRLVEDLTVPDPPQWKLLERGGNVVNRFEEVHADFGAVAKDLARVMEVQSAHDTFDDAIVGLTVPLNLDRGTQVQADRSPEENLLSVLEYLAPQLLIVPDCREHLCLKATLPFRVMPRHVHGEVHAKALVPRGSSDIALTAARYRDKVAGPWLREDARRRHVVLSRGRANTAYGTESLRHVVSNVLRFSGGPRHL
jgi:hypothetical protein